MNYVINSRYGRHKSGTKFYQAFSIHKVGEAPATGITVGHYGKFAIIESSETWNQHSFFRPVLGGQVDVWQGADVSFWEKCQAKFDKGGYDNDEHTWTMQVDDIDSFLQYNFGARHAHALMQALEGRSVTADGNVTGPGTAAHNASINEPKPESWGSW